MNKHMEASMVKVGDSVKIRFHFDPVEGFDAESMWVTVTAIDGDQCEGVVDNEPVFVAEHGYAYGSSVKFTRDEINDHLAIQ